MTNNDEIRIDKSVIEKFDNVYRRFVSTDRVDVFHKMTRSEYYKYCINKIAKMNIQDNKIKRDILSELIDKPKNVTENNITEKIGNPFEILQYDTKTEIQQLVEKRINWFKNYGNCAYSCSCGSGKTIAGIYIMYYKQCRTLIISSRSAVNDQWKVTLETLYPNIIIQTKDGKYKNGVKINTDTPSDVYIFTPQYLANKLNELNKIDKPFSPSLIIYDEVHSLLSNAFIQVLLMPFINVIKGTWTELPYMVALSATYPDESTTINRESLNRIKKIFGGIMTTSSTITNIPVKVWDYRDHYIRVDNNGKQYTGMSALGAYDMKYKSLNEIEAINYFCDKIDKENTIKICPEYKGIIMTRTINASVYAAIYVHNRWKCNVVLVRTSDVPCKYFDKDETIDYNIDEINIENNDIQKIPGMSCAFDKCKDKCCIIVGTTSRLKEGFSVQNLVWGICSHFCYSTISRVQILGRIRRNSTDDELNKHERIFYVLSKRIPSTITIPNHTSQHRVLYDFNIEKIIFKNENYIRI